MNFQFTERKLTLFGLGFGLVILAGLTIYAVERSWERTQQREIFRETSSMVEQILSFQSHILEAESGQRGFLLTRDPHYLGPYHVAAEKVASVLAMMEQKTIQDPFQQKHMEALRARTEKKLAELRTEMDMAQEDPTAATNLVRRNVGHFLTEDIKRDLNAILKREYELLRWADQREKQAADEAFHTIVWGAVVALLLVGGGTYRVFRDTAARELADRLTEQAELLNLAPVMTRRLDGRILSWSKGHERLYGWTEQDAVGKISHDLLKTRLSQPLEEIQATLVRDGQWTGELTQTRQDGTTITVSANWTVLREGRRRPTTIVEANTDISELKMVQAAQAQSEARFRLLADHMSQLAWIADDNGWIHWYNQRWFDYTGTTLPEMEGWGWKKVHHPDHVDRVVEKFSSCVKTGVIWEDTFPLRGRDGQYRWFLSRAVPIHDSQGQILNWFGTNTDITDYRRAEEAKGFLAAIVTNSPDAILTKSVEGIILTWNRGAEGLFGYSAEEIVGQRVEQLVPEELRDEEKRLRQRALLGTSVEQFETQRCHKYKRLIDVSISMSPIYDETGAIIATAQTMRDITLRKQAEKALQASEERFRTLTTAIPQLVWSCQPDGACEYISEQWLSYTGTTLDENLGHGWLSSIHPDDAAMTEQVWRKAVASRQNYIVEYRLRAADGSYHWHLARGTPQRDEQGRIVRWFGTTTDISEQKDTEAALERLNTLLESKGEALASANKELEAFCYSVSHDLRAPLRTMTGFAQALLEDYGHKLEPEAARYLRIISNGATQMGRTIDDLLSFSRLSRQALAMSAISIGDLIKEVREDLAADHAERKITWDIADLPVCRGDRTTIKLVLANLIGNALKYTRPRHIGLIQVGWQIDDQQPTHCQIFIKDNGVGFDMRYADKLFTVFQRLHRSEEFEGTGVGLAIVQRIVHRHGGRVWADARPDEGATFRFTLELAP